MENIFIDGMSVRRPSEKAPDFIKANISVNVEKFIKFANEHKNVKGWIDIDLKKSKEGKLYLALNEFKPKSKVESNLSGDIENVLDEDLILNPEQIPF